jgi:hypothetical protein
MSKCNASSAASKQVDVQNDVESFQGTKRDGDGSRRMIYTIGECNQMETHGLSPANRPTRLVYAQCAMKTGLAG